VKLTAPHSNKGKMGTEGGATE